VRYSYVLWVYTRHPYRRDCIEMVVVVLVNKVLEVVYK
jgi:hypothetical protein